MCYVSCIMYFDFLISSLQWENLQSDVQCILFSWCFLIPCVQPWWTKCRHSDPQWENLHSDVQCTYIFYFPDHCSFHVCSPGGRSVGFASNFSATSQSAPVSELWVIAQHWARAGARVSQWRHVDRGGHHTLAVSYLTRGQLFGHVNTRQRLSDHLNTWTVLVSGHHISSVKTLGLV